MEIHIHIHHHQEISPIINSKLDTIMGKLEDLQAKADAQDAAIAELQTTVDSEQADIKALLDTNASVVAEQQQQIADLKAAAALLVDPTALDPIIAQMEASTAKIVTAKEDISGTV